MSERAAATVAGDGNVYCSGVERAHVVVADVHPGGCAGQEVLNDDVCCGCKLLHQPLASVGFHVDRDRPVDAPRITHAAVEAVAVQ